ncbi:MAG: ABC transporter permease subunit, partial [Chloroflexi bacterium]|nr:ABC transporter permease subunit [Chloroflexota bacterium]
MSRSEPPQAIRTYTGSIAAFLRNEVVLQWIGQIVFLVLVVVAVTQLFSQITGSLEANNISPNFAFLNNRAGFDIGGAENYTPDDSYFAAYLVGVRATLSVVSAGLVGATILGVLLGIFLLSSNWLVRSISRLIVEVLRNTPLLVQIFFAYFVVVLALPSVRDALTFPQSGLTGIPLRLILYALAAVIVWLTVRRVPPERHAWRALLVPGALAAASAIEIGFWLLNNHPAIGAGLYGSAALGDPRLWVYLLANAVVLLILTQVARNARAAALGALTGQLIGALLFYFGIVPDGLLIIELQPIVILSNRGLVYPEVLATARFGLWLVFVVIGVVVAVMVWLYLRRLTQQTGQPHPRWRYALLTLLGFALLGWLIVALVPNPATVPVEQDGAVVLLPLDEARENELLTRADELLYSEAPINVLLPEQRGLRFAPGVTLSQFFVALLLALVVYTASFIAEVVRAGIMAVPRGQIEAARALGLRNTQMLQLVILPQALRVIIPPLGNQYLNLAKNSSLGIAIGYMETYGVMQTAINL